MNIALLGPPGAGKGTQAAKICEKYGVVHISTGDLFRAALKDESDLGRSVKEYLDSGRLVPDEVTSAMVARRIEAPDCADGFMLDGYPRTPRQAEDLSQMLADGGRRLDAAILFDVTEATAVERLSGRRSCPQCGSGYHVKYMPPQTDGVCDECGVALILRTDDEADTIRERLKVYASQTRALVKMYAAAGLLLRVDANGSPETVTDAVSAALERVAAGS